MSAYGILAVSSYRVHGTGIRFRGLGPASTDGTRIVHSRSLADKRTNMWVKIDTEKNELMEVLGPVGTEAEHKALLYHYGILPSKYPAASTFAVIPNEALTGWDDAEEVHEAFSFDGAGCEDIDDALSLHALPDGTWEIGVHISEVASRIDPALRPWILSRASSAYYTDDQGRSRAMHMLPPVLTHQCSLREGHRHPCRSLFVHINAAGQVLGMRHHKTWVHIVRNMTYEELGASDNVADLRAHLVRVAQTHEPTDMIAWTAIEYNKYYGRLLQQHPRALLRAQAQREEPATYVHVGHGSEYASHASIGGSVYTHMTSGIRRAADIISQAILGGLPGWDLTDDELDRLNARMTQVRLFHAHESAYQLALECKQQAQRVQAFLELGDGGRHVRVQLSDRRVRIPLDGSFFVEDWSERILHAPEGMAFEVELFGVLRNDVTELRIRLPDDGARDTAAPAPLPALPEPRTSDRPEASLDAAADVGEARTYLEGLMGYPLDRFQQQALETLYEGVDVLALAPTGSGKSVLAFMGMLYAFARGQRCIYTSPIKALSNQKYFEFDRLLRKIFPDQCRVTLLTGDVQQRCAPPGGDGRPELIIATSEIIANKLESPVEDPDLVGVGMLCIDEAHYINDDERGHVWERTLLRLPSDIPIVALSATLEDPQRLCDWMSQRRPTKIVQRHDRHVPLHFGGLNEQGDFAEFYCTHGPNGFATQVYDACRQTGPWPLPKLLAHLDRQDMLPAIVFAFSRVKCVQAAESIKANLMLGSKMRGRERGECEYEYAYEAELHSEYVQEIRQKQRRMFQRYLQPYASILEQIPGFDKFMEMLDRGVAYHHAGMLSLLREYVELLFQERLIKVVFATESLGIGINMPCKTVVYTSLEKPDGNQGYRLLRSDEYFQGCGRAGRRGLDTKGYVVYAPVQGPPAASHTFASLLLGKPKAVESKLVIDPVFVLRQLVLARDGEGQVLTKTLRQHQCLRQLALLEARRDQGGGPAPSASEQADLDRARVLYDKLHPPPGSLFKLTPQQRKKAQQELASLEKGRTVDWKTAWEQQRQRQQLEEEMAACRSALQTEWNQAMAWLTDREFLAPGTSVPTARGRTAALFVDAHPLVRGTLVWEGALHEASFEDMAAWLACFAEPVPFRPDAPALPPLASSLRLLIDRTREVAIELGLDVDTQFAWQSVHLLSLWLETKDIRVVAAYVNQLGSFVRLVLRVAAFIEELRSATLGLERLEVYNRLEHAGEHLYHGVVTNQSLYVNSK